MGFHSIKLFVLILIRSYGFQHCGAQVSKKPQCILGLRKISRELLIKIQWI